MSSRSRVSDTLVLVSRGPDGRFDRSSLTVGDEVPAKAHTAYALQEATAAREGTAWVVRREAEDLVVEGEDGETLLRLTDFFQDATASFFPEGVSDQGDAQAGLAFQGDAITAASPLSVEAEGDAIVWRSAEAPESFDDASGFLSLSGGIAGAGLLGAAALTGGGGGGDGGAPDTDSQVQGTVVGGPVLAGNGLVARLYQADGETLLAEVKVGDDGTFRASVGDYRGLVIARIEDLDGGDDYLDEATSLGKDLNAELFAVGEVSGANDTVVLNLNVITTLAYRKALELAGEEPLTPELVAQTQQAIAELFGLEDLHAVTVIPTNGGAYDDGDGLDAGESYGAMLAAFSGLDDLEGGDSQRALDKILAGLTIDEEGQASLSESAQGELVKGSQQVDQSTDGDTTDDVSPIIDTHAPRWEATDVDLTLDEASGAGQVVHRAEATDASGQVTYSLKAVDDHAMLSIDAATGEVTLTGDPDHETQSSYSFTVIATDAAGNTSEQAVTLTINDLDEVAPTITSGATATAIDENSGAGQVIYTATADDSGDVSGGVTYSLKEEDDHALLSIDAATGEVTLTGDPDHETKASYDFTAVATDAAGNQSEQAVMLSVNDLDESAPTITSGATASAIDENSGAGQVIYTASATDTADTDDATDTSAGVTYSLKATGDHALLSIDADTGAVTLTGDPDHETQSSYAFTVVATDAAGTQSEQAVTLTVNDLDESAPTLTSGATATAIDENSGAGQVIYTASATDTADTDDATDTSAGVTYSLKATGDHALLSIDADTGAVTLTGDPDHESQSSYAFTVVATDAAGNQSEQAVTLTVNDLDESAPTITSGATATAIDENSGAGQVIYTASATDTADTDDATDTSAGVTYSLKATGDHALLSVDASTGEVTLTDDPDHETQSSYAFTVVATDAAGNQSEQAVTLTVNDLDESAPTLTSGATATAIDENSGAGQVIYTASANDTADTDDATDTSAGVTYRLKATGDHALLSIDADTGAVTLTGDPDHETQSSYSFTVVATDAAGNSDEQAVTLTVNDLDESAPTITSGATATAIDENSGAGQVIYTATSTDTGDIATGSTSYSLKAVGDHALLSIDAATGAVTLTGDPDHETQSSYSFTVVATDAAGNQSEQAVTLSVNDLDESAPTLTSGATATAIDENSGAGQVIYTASATDTADTDDATDTSAGVTYSLKATGDHALLSIDADTGAVTLTGDPDHESQSSYSFTVVATDAAGNASEQVVTLTINDLDESVPTITSGATATAIDENSGSGQVIYTASATDTADTDDATDTSGALTYSLKAVGDHDAFSIDADTGAVTLTGDPDHETQSSYAFTVVATDAAGNASEQSVTLAVNDLDESAPSVTSGATATAIDENSGAGQVVYTATATDTADTDDATDTSGALTYSLKAVDDHAAFSIDASTGEVTLAGDPDHETQSSYAFTVVATDASGNQSEQAVTLSVNDLDESAPTITSGTTATAIDENSGAGQVIYTASATDTADTDDATDTSAGVTYSLNATGDHALLSIDADTGAVMLTGDPDHESQSSYAFTVVATDVAGNASEQAVTLGINDLDESTPTITSGTTATAIDENSGAGQIVYTASATDTADTDDATDTSAGVTYSLKATGDHALLSIDANTGAVTLTGDPDHETKSSYSFTVIATDDAGNSSEQAVTLTVNDLDESAPTITSDATATAIDENSGANQVIYTAVADDSGDVSGGVTFSLKEVDDHADFGIDAATGEVTLTVDPDYETQSSYAFTVVATDAAGNSDEQAVSLAINDIADETAPTVTEAKITGSTGAQNATLNAGDTVKATVTMSEATTVDTSGGTPRIALTVGGSTVYADYVSGSGTDSLVFEYVIQAGDNDADGITIGANPLEANGGTLEDAAGNTADLTLASGTPFVILKVDTDAPTLSSSTPSDDATAVAAGDDLVLTFGETVQAGTGNITISDGAGDDRVIDVTDTTQIAISGNQVTINPTADLNTDSGYSVRIDAGALTDVAGNAYAGIDDTTTLNFTTESDLDTSVVVFDMVGNASSDHSGRTFSAAESYTIYLRVDSASGTGLNTGSADWGQWSGANNLGSDDRLVLVGTGSSVLGSFGNPVSTLFLWSQGVSWKGSSNSWAGVWSQGRGYFSRGSDFTHLWTGSSPSKGLWSGGTLGSMYLTDMPAGVLTSQGLA
ncbi:cadherin domain-containing protein [Halomonas organivorans]